jgi:RimJ/RimL family protein N-acetyltransferase
VEKPDHFFTGIFTVTGELIGVLKGQIRSGRDCMAWINTLIIDPAFQNKGYGTKVVKLFINYVKWKSNISKVYLSVAENNVGGYRFWSRLGFVQYGRIDKCATLKGELQNAIIMHKVL